MWETKTVVVMMTVNRASAISVIPFSHQKLTCLKSGVSS